MSRASIEAFFLPRDEHSLFCLLFGPPAGQACKGAIVHVPAFAEEMNKSRRAVANVARALAERGWLVLVFDLHGTGDSSGDFSEASWQGWLADIRTAFHWLRDRSAVKPALWGLRAGCLLINDALDQVDTTELILWQPALAGDAALTQFLRLRTVGAAVGPDGPKDTTRGLLAELQAGKSLEVAGYMLPPMIALPLRQSRLGGARYGGKRISWLEVSATEPPECSPASKIRIEELRAAGADVVSRAVAGSPFWMTQEIDEGHSLVPATVELMREAP